MAISLTKPSIGSTDWGTSLNSNFTSIESALNAGNCKAWVNFNGVGTVAIRASHNVNSITDLGTGLYRVNLGVAMADANYAVYAMAQRTLSGSVCCLTSFPSSATYNQITPSSFTISAADSNNAKIDPIVFCAGVFGNS